MAEQQKTPKKILSTSQEEVKQILTILPNLESIESQREILAQGTVEVQIVESSEPSILDLFLLRVHLRDHRGLEAPERDFPTFLLPVQKSQLLHLLELLEAEFRPSFDAQVLSALDRIEKAVKSKESSLVSPCSGKENEDKDDE